MTWALGQSLNPLQHSMTLFLTSSEAVIRKILEVEAIRMLSRIFCMLAYSKGNH